MVSIIVKQICSEKCMYMLILACFQCVIASVRESAGRREGRREGGRCPTKNLEVLLVISCPRT